MSARARNRGKTPRLGDTGGVQPPRPPRSFPLPHVLDAARAWRVVDAPRGGSVARAGKEGPGVMSVPLDQTPRSRGIRLHEMAHVKWSPAGMPGADGIPFETVNAVEDCRIHKRLNEVGLSRGGRDARVLSDDDYERFEAAITDEKVSPLDVGRMVAASIGTADGAPIVQAARDAGADWVVEIVHALYDRYMAPRRPAWKRTVEMATALQAALEDPPDDHEMAVAGAKAGVLPGEEDSPGGVQWGTMTIRTMPMPIRMKRGLTSRQRRATDTGACPRNWHRMPTDGRVFDTRRKQPAGGSVLIDQSGSMALNPDDIQAIIDHYPGVLIATYAGHGTHGELRIIAHNGKRATDEDCYHPMGGNVIDGPALQWLAQQPAPRIWVSDGGVCDTNGHTQPAITDALRITTRNQIQRIPNLTTITRNT